FRAAGDRLRAERGAAPGGARGDPDVGGARPRGVLRGRDPALPGLPARGARARRDPGGAGAHACLVRAARAAAPPLLALSLQPRAAHAGGEPPRIARLADPRAV